MPIDKFKVMKGTVDKLLEEFFDSERSSITIKKYEEVDSEGKGFPAFEVVLKGKRG